jgi:uncharacterized protein (DUF433 family)
MTFAFEPTTAVPLRTDANNTVRIGQTRVTLETLVRTWNQGSSPEEIVEAYPALHLDDVYAVIAYVLRHPAEVKAYMQETEVAEQQTLESIKTWFPESPALRARVLARANA